MRKFVICGKFWFSDLIWRKLWLRLIKCSQVFTVRLLLVKNRVVSGFNSSRVVILISRTGMAVEKNKFSKIPNWRHYLLKTSAICKKNWQNHWEWLNKPFWNASRLWEWFRSKKVGFRTSWSREMLNDISLLVNSCLKDRIERGYYIALWSATKCGSTTVIPSAENHRECPDTPPRRRPDRTFSVPRLCFAFGDTSSVLCIMNCWNRVKPSQGIGEMGGLTPPAVISRRCSSRLPFISIDGTRPDSSAFPLLWTRQKIDRLVNHLKRRIIWLATDSILGKNGGSKVVYLIQ